MKAIKNVFQVLALVFGLGAIVLFFTNFATITGAKGAITATGAQLGFGANITAGDVAYNMAVSSDILFCIILAAISAISAGLSFKFRNSIITSSVVSAIAGIYMLVIALSDANKYVDSRPLSNVTSIDYSVSVILCALALLLAAVIGVAFLFIRNYIEVKESNGKKKTIVQKVVQFLRDYKGELKKIVWPNVKTVVRNTVIVLVVCLIVGAFIWIFDFALAKLLDLVWQI